MYIFVSFALSITVLIFYALRWMFIDPDWQLVFKAVSGIAKEPMNNGEFDPNDLGQVWGRPQALNEDIPEARQLNSAYKGHFKSSAVDNWDSYYINKV